MTLRAGKPPEVWRNSHEEFGHSGGGLFIRWDGHLFIPSKYKSPATYRAAAEPDPRHANIGYLGVERLGHHLQLDKLTRLNFKYLRDEAIL